MTTNAQRRREHRQRYDPVPTKAGLVLIPRLTRAKICACRGCICTRSVDVPRDLQAKPYLLVVCSGCRRGDHAHAAKPARSPSSGPRRRARAKRTEQRIRATF